MPPCIWKEDFDGNWETDCDELFVFNEGGPKENNMKFCCYCGKPLGERKYGGEEDQP